MGKREMWEGRREKWGGSKRRNRVTPAMYLDLGYICPKLAIVLCIAVL